MLVSSLTKIVSALHVRTYASERTERTPENRVGTGTFLRLVTFVSVCAAVLVIYLLTEHAKTTVKVMQAQEQNGFFDSDLLVKVEDAIASVQTSVFVTMVLHCLLHFLTHRLDTVESDLPRIVDLLAQMSKPKAE